MVLLWVLHFTFISFDSLNLNKYAIINKKGIAYILKLLDQQHDFESLHWFQSVKEKFQANKVFESILKPLNLF